MSVVFNPNICKRKNLFALIFLCIISNLNAQIPEFLPNYPLVLDSTQGTYSSGASPIIADFNNDGENEILVCVNLSLNIGTIYLLNRNGNIMPNFPKKVSCISSDMNSAAGDVNGDGFIDIIVKADSLYVFNYNGNILNGFPAFFPNTFNNLGDRLAVYDLDNNGNLEIIVGRGNNLSVYNSNGQIRNGWPKIFNLGSNVSVSFPSIGDLNNDNIPEIIAPVSNYNFALGLHDSNKVYIFEPDGQLYLNPVINSDSNYYFWFNPAVIFKNKQKDSTFFVINSNNSPDGSPNSFKSRVTVYNSAGSIVNRFNLIPRFVLDQISMGDLDNDSLPDLVFGNSFNQVYAYTLKGDLFPGFPVFSDSYEYRSSSIGKLSSDVCFFAMNGVDTINYLQAYNNLGTQLSWSPLYPDGIPLSAVTYGDLNNDKQVDFLITTFGINHINNGDATGLYAWTLPGTKYASEDFPWPMYAHDRYRTNQYGFVPPDEPVGILPSSTLTPDKFNLHQNYPNPFNPVTNLEFEISELGFVSLKVYDVLGKDVTILVNEKLSSGSYRIQFDGSKLTSGVYFYSLETESYRETKKFILLK